MTPLRGLLGALAVLAAAAVGLTLAAGDEAGTDRGPQEVSASSSTSVTAPSSTVATTVPTTTTAPTTIAPPPPTAPPAVVPTEPAVYRDRAYGADDRQRMDLYVPAGPGPHPVVAWVHGGGWQTGDKDLVPAALRDALVANGYAVATVNYRLSGDPGPEGVPPAPPAVSHPYPLMDIKNAVRWLQEHAGPYALDPTAVVLSGYSAGGHLAVLAATSADAPALVGPPVTLPGGDPPVRGVLAYAAPLDLALVQGSTLEVEQRALRGMIGCPAVGTCDTRGADARTYLDPGDPPIALVTGTADLLVPPTHAASFQASADEVGYAGLTRHEEAGFTHEMVSDVPDVDFALGWLRLLVG